MKGVPNRWGNIVAYAADTSRFRRCQFIAGEPSVDDACKCLEPVIEGSSYCDLHHSLCWQVHFLQPRQAYR